jgi:hypothetical protein
MTRSVPTAAARRSARAHTTRGVAATRKRDRERKAELARLLAVLVAAENDRAKLAAGVQSQVARLDRQLTARIEKLTAAHDAKVAAIQETAAPDLAVAQGQCNNALLTLIEFASISWAASQLGVPERALRAQVAAARASGDGSPRRP